MGTGKHEDSLGTTNIFNKGQNIHRFILWKSNDLLIAILKYSQLDIKWGFKKAVQKQLNPPKICLMKNKYILIVINYINENTGVCQPERFF